MRIVHSYIVAALWTIIIVIKANLGFAASLTFIYQDHLGSASLMTDSEGNNPQKRTYYPFGSIETEEVIGHEPNAYNDKDLDAKTKLYNFEARMYAAQKMHFTTPDTIVPDPSNGQSWNRYAYVRNNPLKYIDPSGHAEKVYNNTLKVEKYFQEAEWDDNFFGTALYGVVFAGSESLDSVLNFPYDFSAGMSGDWEGAIDASMTLFGVAGASAASKPMTSQLKESLGRGTQWLKKQANRLTRRGQLALQPGSIIEKNDSTIVRLVKGNKVEKLPVDDSIINQNKLLDQKKGLDIMADAGANAVRLDIVETPNGIKGLQDYIPGTRVDKLSPEQLARVQDQVDVIHEIGLSAGGRDLTLENMILDLDGVVRLVDAGTKARI